MWGANGMALRCWSTILGKADDLYIDSVNAGSTSREKRPDFDAVIGWRL